MKLLIDSTDTMHCVGALEDGRGVVTHISRLHPDVILMDIDMPHVNGIEALRLIKKTLFNVKILMQTVFEDEVKIFDAIMEGADGYILKKTSPDNVVEAIVDVYNGGSPMTPAVARQVINLFKNKHERVAKTDFALSAREYEVLSFLVQGLSYKMIAEKCNVSYSTVNSHISNIYKKLHVNSGPQAVAKAIELKL
ncbi:MAG TPA: response regulator transcription factor [Candidatus Kapabacteria bacterium]|nr:response regulator transcription factor [Candidatus Kapabacteria bacterium]